MPNNAADTTNIDEAIAYLESPEYLRMIAHQQGEFPDSLLFGSRSQPWEHVETEETPAPQPVDYGILAEWERDLLRASLNPPPHSANCSCSEHVPEYNTSPSQFGIEWNSTTNRCDCRRCRVRNAPEEPPVPAWVQLRVRDPWWKFRHPLHDRRPFKTYGELRGVARPEREGSAWLEDYFPSAHHLWRADHGKIDYVVYSFQTPIAWHVTGVGYDEWVYPNVRYSRRTSGHQNKIRTALDANHAQYGAYLRMLER